MGSINYKSNDILTIGYNIPKKEKEAIKNLKEEIKNTLTENNYFKKYDILEI